MITREIAAPDWQAFADEFSKHHQGTVATVEVISPDLGAQEEARALPFVGISFDDRGSERGSITLLLGTDPDAHAEHRIEHPERIWLRTGGDGESDAIEIEAADNTKTILLLQPIPALPKYAGSRTYDERKGNMDQTADQSVVAVFRNHADAEEAVRLLQRGGIPMNKVSIIGKDWRVREDVQGYYQPGDAALEGAREGAWLGGLFGLFMGFGYFLFPIIGPLVVLGPLAGMVAGAVGGAGIGALVSGLMAMGLSKEQALKYQARLEAGEFLLVVRGTQAEVEKAREILQTSGQTDVQMHGMAMAA